MCLYTPLSRIKASVLVRATVKNQSSLVRATVKNQRECACTRHTRMHGLHCMGTSCLPDACSSMVSTAACRTYACMSFVAPGWGRCACLTHAAPWPAPPASTSLAGCRSAGTASRAGGVAGGRRGRGEHTALRRATQGVQLGKFAISLSTCAFLT